MNELKGFLPCDEGSFSKSHSRYGSLSQNTGSEFMNRLKETHRNLVKDLMSDKNTRRKIRPQFCSQTYIYNSQRSSLVNSRSNSR